MLDVVAAVDVIAAHGGLIQYRTVIVSWKERAKLGAWMCCLQDFAGRK